MEQSQGNKVNPIVLHKIYKKQNRVYKNDFASVTRFLLILKLLHMVSDPAC